MRKVFIHGNYIVVTDEDDLTLFQSPIKATFCTIRGNEVKIYNIADESFFISTTLDKLADENGDPYGQPADWLRNNTGA